MRLFAYRVILAHKIEAAIENLIVVDCRIFPHFIVGVIFRLQSLVLEELAISSIIFSLRIFNQWLLILLVLDPIVIGRKAF